MSRACLLLAALLSLALGTTPAAPRPAPKPATTCPPAASPLTAAEVQQATTQGKLRGLLWEARKDGRSLWLYGTVHAAKRDWPVPGPHLLKLMSASDLVALELDMTDPAVLRQLQSGVLMPSPPQQLPAALRARLNKLADQACAKSLIQPLRLELQAITLVSLAGRVDGVDPAYGVDNLIAIFARQLGKPIVSLETPDTQLQALLAPDTRSRNRLVAEALDSLESGQAQRVLTRLLTAWEAGQEDELARYGEWCDCLNTDDQRAQHKRLLDDRNHDMARKAIALHTQGKQVFVAVGALHLTGPQGLPALLKAQGFDVKRLTDVVE